jgi:hypothetical protein
MTETDGAAELPERPRPGTAVVLQRDDTLSATEPRSVTWRPKRPVLVGGLLLVLAEVVWKAHFLSRLYFRDDDYVNQVVALKSPLGWHYLSLIAQGHFFPGVWAVNWLLVRISLLNWGLDASVLLILAAAASLAALRLLLSLFGERPAILLPLAVYALTPLSLPDLGWWTTAIESVPLQLAIFMMLKAHVEYVRNGRARQLAEAGVWLAVGLLFNEKAVLLAPLALAITAGFLTESRALLAGIVLALKRYWRAWLAYAALMAAYVVAFLLALRSSTEQPQAPPAGAALTFSWVLVKETFLTGAVGGPWRWLPYGDRLFALALPTHTVEWLAWLIAVAVIGTSVMIRRRAWRAWAILLGWIVFADMVPIFVGRMVPGIGNYFAGLLALETRYLAEAPCILAICLGLAFIPLRGASRRERPARQRLIVLSVNGRRHAISADRAGRYATGVALCFFVIGSLWSVQSYEDLMTGGPAARSYIENAEQALRQAPPGTHVLDQNMPQLNIGPPFEKDTLESFILGSLVRGAAASHVRWIFAARGTVNNLRIFGGNGELYPAVISGDYSARLSGTAAACLPVRHGRIVVRFQHPTSSGTQTLHIGYLWGGSKSAVAVWFGSYLMSLQVLPGLHNAYLPVAGTVSQFTVSARDMRDLCISGAEAGTLVPYGAPIP